MSDIAKQKETKKFYIVMAISLAIMIGFGFIPPFTEPITSVGMRILGIFIGMIFGWIFGYNGITAVMALVVCGLFFPGQTADTLFGTAFGAQPLMIVFWALIFVYGLNKCGILGWVSAKILSWKWVSKSPWHLAMGMWLCTIMCAAICCQPFATMLIMFSIFYDVAEKIGAKRRSSYSVFVLVFICGFSALAIGLVPYSGNLFVALSFMLAVDPTITYSVPAICAINWALTLGMYFFTAIISKIAFATFAKPEFSLENAQGLFTKTEKMNKKVKLGFTFIIILLLIMIVPMLLPAESPVKTFMSGFGTAGLFAALVVVMSLVTVDGERFITIEGALEDGAVHWSIYFIMGSAIALGNLLVSEEAGIAALLQGVLNNMTGNMSLYVLATVLLIALLILTNCITNVVAAQLVIPIVTMVFMSKDVNPGLVVGMMAIVFDYGLVLPSGSPLGAFMHGNSEWMTSGQVYKYASISVITVALSIACIGVPLAMLFI